MFKRKGWVLYNDNDPKTSAGRAFERRKHFASKAPKVEEKIL